MIHALITLCICIEIIMFKLPMLLVFLPSMFYLGREYTQAEYRYIEAYCNRKREAMPWYAPFLLKSWTLKGLCDWLCPLLVSIIIYCLDHFYFSYKLLQ